MGTSEPWAFGLVGKVIRRSWIVWVLKRINSAAEEKVGGGSGGFVPLASLHSFTYSCVCTAQVMYRAAGEYQMPDAAACARGNGLDEHRNRWSIRVPRSCSAPAMTCLQWPSPRCRARASMAYMCTRMAHSCSRSFAVYTSRTLQCGCWKSAKSTGDGTYVHNFLEVRMHLEVGTHRDKSDNEST